MTIKNIVLFCIILLISPLGSSFAQNQITAAPAIGLYLYNSENSLPVMGDENYLLNYGFELSYCNKNLLGYVIQFDYSYLYSSKDNVLTFEVYDPSPTPKPNRFSYADVSLVFNNFDVSFIGGLGRFFSFGLGASFSIVDRTINIDNKNFVYEDFIDRLSSFCMGLNGLIEMQIPFTEDINHWYFYSGLKIRYLHGFFYDEGLRDLSNYNQNFLTANLAIGIGYNF
jgi:hypothetical protein